METLMPNQMELEWAKLDATLNMDLESRLLKVRELDDVKELGDAGLRLKGFIAGRELELKEYALSSELATKKALSQVKASELSDDTAGKLFKEGLDLMKLTQEANPDKTAKDLYGKDPVYTHAINNLLRAQAIRNGIPPEDYINYIEYQYEQKREGGLFGLFDGIGKAISGGLFGEALPETGFPELKVPGGFAAFKAKTQTEEEKEEAAKKQAKQTEEDVGVVGEWLESFER